MLQPTLRSIRPSTIAPRSPLPGRSCPDDRRSAGGDDPATGRTKRRRYGLSFVVLTAPPSMRLRRALLLSTTALLLATAVRAEQFPNAGKGYSFEAPSPWRLAHPDFMLTGPGGASLSEVDLPPRGVRSLEKISKSAGMIACIGADYEDTDEQFQLDGHNWTGLVRVYREPQRSNRQRRHVLQLVAQHEQNYRLFYLAVPTHDWLSDRVPFTQVLSGLRFQ